MTLDADSLAVLALTNRLVDSGVAPLKASEFWRLLARAEHPSRLVGLDRPALAEVLAGSDLDPERVARLLDTGVGLAARLEALHDLGIFVLAATDPRFPPRVLGRLGPTAPPVLYCAGNLALLGTDGIGIVGSSDAGSGAIDVTERVARCVAEAALALVTGGAAGLDDVAAAAAHASGGATVAVLPGALQQAIGRRHHRAAVLAGRSLLCTPYRPDATATPASAAGRSKIGFALARVTLAVCCAEGDDTWLGASEALQHGFGAVAVWRGAGAGPGNPALVQAGGVPVDRPDHLLDIAAGGRDEVR